MKNTTPEFFLDYNEHLDDFRLEIRHLLDSVIKKYSRMETNEKIFKFVSGLESKYGDDCSNYEAYHLLTRSSIDRKETPYMKFDFPEEDSVKKFLESLLE